MNVRAGILINRISADLIPLITGVLSPVFGLSVIGCGQTAMEA
jgi:hypothetical protein